MFKKEQARLSIHTRTLNRPEKTADDVEACAKRRVHKADYLFPPAYARHFLEHIVIRGPAVFSFVAGWMATVDEIDQRSLQRLHHSSSLAKVARILVWQKVGKVKGHIGGVLHAQGNGTGGDGLLKDDPPHLGFALVLCPRRKGRQESQPGSRVARVGLDGSQTSRFGNK